MDGFIKLESTQELRIHKCTKNSLHLIKIGHQLNKKNVEIQIGNNPIHTIRGI